MAADEAAQMSQAVQDTVAAPEGDLQKPLMLMDEKLLSRLAHTYLFFFFFWVPSVFLGLFSSMLEQYISPSVPGSLLLILEQRWLPGAFGLVILLTTLCFTCFTLLYHCAWYTFCLHLIFACIAACLPLA